jgi:sigma-B regulation protein RsbU (phosphoserine phosphatase)
MRKHNILVVDDTVANLRLLSTMLSEQGYKVRSVVNGPMALTAARSAPPDLILLDINLPDMNGYQVCQELKDDQRTHDIPVIFISALDETVDKVKAFAVGGVDYITKPFQFEEVLARVKTHLALRSLQQELEKQVTALRVLTARLQSDLALARDIQQSLLPPPSPAWPGLEVVCYSRSAREVGGDFYSYHVSPALSPSSNGAQGERFGLAVGDVSGKGVSAALLMATSLSLFGSTLSENLSPDRLLLQLDRALVPYTRPRRQNCALCYVTLEADRLRAVNAACIPPYIRRAGGHLEWLDIGGFALGQGLGIQGGYQEVCLTLSPGDLVILTSDGVVEAKNIHDEMFGFERLEQAIAAGPTASAQAMLDHLLAEIETFTGDTEPHDDMTLALMRLEREK